ncbi:MAG: conjugal transfer protein TraX [Lachnospiraceae bacterium]|nr:conjugal transfer protein TraX [Lachnospiraceae bacterium]
MKKGGLSGAALKWLAIVCMAIDHIGATVALQYFYRMAWFGTEAQYQTAYNLYMVLRCIGRFSFPVYCFLLVEGFYHTRSRGRYLRNLAVFALISEIPFDLAFYDTVFETSHQNVFMTLAMGLAALWLAELLWRGLEKRAGRSEKLALAMEKSPVEVFAFRAVVGLVAVAPMALLAEVLNTDYGGWGVAIIYVFYLLHDRKTLAATVSVAIMTVMQSIEIFGFPGILAIHFYNGTRGRQMKYFFYIFYPAHLLILYGVCRLLGYY